MMLMERPDQSNSLPEMAAVPVLADGAECHSHQCWGLLGHTLTPQSVECKAGNQSSRGAVLRLDFLMLTSPQATCSVSAAELGPQFC